MDGSHMIEHWQGVRAGLIETIDKFGEDNLDYQPFHGSWTVRQMILHIAHEESIEVSYGIAGEVKEVPKVFPPEDYPTLEAIKSLLEEVHSKAENYLEGLSAQDLQRVVNTPWGTQQVLLDMFEHIIDHEVHHRGELSLIVGLCGKTGLDA